MWVYNKLGVNRRGHLERFSLNKTYDQSRPTVISEIIFEYVWDRDRYDVSINSKLFRNQPDYSYHPKDTEAEHKSPQDKLREEFYVLHKSLTNCCQYNGRSDATFRCAYIETKDIGKLLTALHYIEPFDSETLHTLSSQFQFEFNNLHQVLKQIIERDIDTTRAIDVVLGFCKFSCAQLFECAVFFEQEYPTIPKIAIDFYETIDAESPLYQDAKRKISWLNRTSSDEQDNFLEEDSDARDQALIKETKTINSKLLSTLLSAQSLFKSTLESLEAIDPEDKVGVNRPGN